MKHRWALLLLCTLVLGSCGKSASPSETAEPTSAAKTAAVGTALFGMEKTRQSLPSAPLGIFSTVFLSQGLFLPTRSALEGIESLLSGLSEETMPNTEDAYALLESLGSIVSINLIDTLNRSSDRAETLNRYVEALGNATTQAEEQVTALTELKTTLKEERDAQRTTVRNLQRTISKALADKDYSLAGSTQKELSEAESTLAETETKEKQNNDLLSRLKDLVGTAKERQKAIEENREILLSGLKITDVPGLEDLGIFGSKASGTQEKNSATDSLF
ncbi:MAG: hypothetical protein PHI23_00200 [Candidatus Peribacteraceae bacterium]|nr:hypothetical protein [Candidatus Peribacteraceae bacterium]